MEHSNRILELAIAKAPEKEAELRTFHNSYHFQPSSHSGDNGNLVKALHDVTDACNGQLAQTCNFNGFDKKYRRINGQCNHQLHPLLGSARTVLRRLIADRKN